MGILNSEKFTSPDGIEAEVSVGTGTVLVFQARVRESRGGLRFAMFELEDGRHDLDLLGQREVGRNILVQFAVDTRKILKMERENTSQQRWIWQRQR